MFHYQRPRTIARLLRHRRIAAALVAFAFSILVSVAATHIHVLPDQDEACAVCAAFAGKLEGPSQHVVAPAPFFVVFQTDVTVREPCNERFAIVALPPSCGPPLSLLA